MAQRPVLQEQAEGTSRGAQACRRQQQQVHAGSQVGRVLADPPVLPAAMARRPSWSRKEARPRCPAIPSTCWQNRSLGVRMWKVLPMKRGM